jgi:OOP family OmpA-OmpF porin
VLVLLLALGGADWIALNLVVAPKVFAPPIDSSSPAILPSKAIPSEVPTQAVASIAIPPAAAAPSTAQSPQQVEKPQLPQAPSQATASAPTRASTPLGLPAIPSVHFDGMSAFLTADTRNTLCSVARRMKVDLSLRVKVIGHTDTRGEDDLNMRLSQRRAQAVSDFLQLIGIDGARIETTASGATNPIDTTQSWDSNRKNRRVELVWQ